MVSSAALATTGRGAIVDRVEAMGFCRLTQDLQLKTLQEKAVESESVVKDHENRIKLARFRRYFTQNLRRRILIGWGDYSRRKKESRRLKKAALALYRAREGRRGLKRWHRWAEWQGIYRFHKERADRVRLRNVQKHCFHMWAYLTRLDKNIAEEKESARFEAYVHACKNMIRLWHSMLEIHTPIPRRYFPVWKEEVKYLREVEAAVAWVRRNAIRHHFRGWAEVWRAAKDERWAAEVEAVERQKALLGEMAAAEEELEEMKRQEAAAEEAHRQAVKAAERQARDYRMHMQHEREKAEKHFNEAITLDVQDEHRKKHKAHQLELRLAKFHAEWDKKEEVLVREAKDKGLEYIRLKPGSKWKCEDPKAQNMIDKYASKMVDKVIAPVHNKTEREELRAAATAAPPREGVLVWQIRLETLTNTKFYVNIDTDEMVTPEQVQSKKQRQVPRRMARDNYVAECGVLARRKAIVDRAAALVHMREEDAALCVQRCWRRGKAKVALHELQWLTEVRDDLHRKKKKGGAVVTLQRIFRGNRGRRAARRARASTVHCKVDKKTGHHFYFDERTHESTWVLPKGLVEGDVPPPPDWALRIDHLDVPFYFNSRSGHKSRAKPRGYRLCVSCELDFAMRKCVDRACLDIYCLDCFIKHHAKGERQWHKHEPVAVEPAACERCPRGGGKVRRKPKIAEHFCESCGMIVCAACEKKMKPEEQEDHIWKEF
eukprot:g4099.t1